MNTQVQEQNIKQIKKSVGKRAVISTLICVVSLGVLIDAVILGYYLITGELPATHIQPTNGSLLLSNLALGFIFPGLASLVIMMFFDGSNKKEAAAIEEQELSIDTELQRFAKERYGFVVELSQVRKMRDGYAYGYKNGVAAQARFVKTDTNNWTLFLEEKPQHKQLV